jgi:hypothetical protein
MSESYLITVSGPVWAMGGPGNPVTGPRHESCPPQNLGPPRQSLVFQALVVRKACLPPGNHCFSVQL